MPKGPNWSDRLKKHVNIDDCSSDVWFFFTSVREKKTGSYLKKRFTKHNIRGVWDLKEKQHKGNFPWKFLTDLKYIGYAQHHPYYRKQREEIV